MRRTLFIDTNIYVEAYLDASSESRKLVNAAGAGLVEVAVSARFVEELVEVYRKVLGREQAARIRASVLLFPRLRVVDSLELERATSAVAAFVRDSADLPHLAAARAARADAFVSYNRRSVLPGIFDLVPLAPPHMIVPAVEGRTQWPTREDLLADWQAWARRSRRRPRDERLRR